MKLELLRMDNFLCYGEPVVVDFSPMRRVLVSGPNGSGKTTIVEAIVYALYGETSTRRRRDRLANRFSSRNDFLVELVFSLDGVRYEVSRGVRRRRTWMRVVSDGRELDEVHIRHLNDVIGRRLGTKDMFVRSVYFPQYRFDVLAGLTPAARRHVLESFIGLGAIRAAHERVSARAAEVEEARGRLTDHIGRTQIQRNMLAEELAAMEAPPAVSSVDVGEHRERVERLEAELAEVRRRLDRLVGEREHIVKRRKRLRALALKGEPPCPLCGQTISSEHAERELDALGRRIGRLDGEISSVEREVDQLHELETSARRDYLAAEERYAAHYQYLRQKARLESRIRDLDEELRRSRAKLDALLDGDRGLVMYAAQLLGRQVPDEMVNVAVPFIAERANAYLKTLAPDMTVTVNEDFSIVVERNSGGASYEELSGGERRLVDLVLSLALWETAGIRYGYRPDVLVFDEPFDNLDDSHTERFIDLIHALDVDLVLVMSHSDDVKARFAEVLEVRKEGRTSRLHYRREYA